MGKINNIEIGTKYGDYKIISIPYFKNNQKTVDCECNCGYKLAIPTCRLQRITSCRQCKGYKIRKHKIGDKLYSLTILRILPTVNNRPYIEVQCDCGSVYKLRHDSYPQIKECKKCSWTKVGKNNKQYKGLEFVSKKYYTIIQHHAENRNREFKVTIEYINNLLIKQNHKCIFSGLDIKIGNVREKNTASLDRIDSTKGYIEGNVQWVHKDINKMKGSLPDKYFIDLCVKIADNKRNFQSEQS